MAKSTKGKKRVDGRTRRRATVEGSSLNKGVGRALGSDF